MNIEGMLEIVALSAASLLMAPASVAGVVSGQPEAVAGGLFLGTCCAFFGWMAVSAIRAYRDDFANRRPMTHGFEVLVKRDEGQADR